MGAADTAHGMESNPTKRRRRALRRNERVSIEAPGRTLLHGLHGHGGGSPRTVDQIGIRHVQLLEEDTHGEAR
jgi:hypothetical protein